MFDIAATGDVNIGQSTKETGQDLATITELLKPSKTHYTYTCESEEYFFYFQLFVILLVYMVPVWTTIRVHVVKDMMELCAMILVRLLECVAVSMCILYSYAGMPRRLLSQWCHLSNSSWRIFVYMC